MPRRGCRKTDHAKDLRIVEDAFGGSIPVDKLTTHVVIDCEAIGWLAVVANVQLALKHPENGGEGANYAGKIAGRILTGLEEKGIITRKMRELAFKDLAA